ncbi:hypothetical protein [Roseibium sp. RKSG952]|uniref:hypothetical protein n=1 Tax=Roseibium sp. RKSG952 TaxID=2529384 RepID=UPI0012BBE337|nr:hypothetical protein [Roseibium sp. RKSG952]MTH95450.1 hypothetical protein [Roseibium sp. RKSG952]
MKVIEQGMSSAKGEAEVRWDKLFDPAVTAAYEIGVIRFAGGTVCDIFHILGSMRSVDSEEQSKTD